ncbi:MAG: hypothetical protein LBP81_07510 [Treponema sp.]|jgi:hypothetical protein|nr:hypothetical protein [Treponema sp.]
MNIRKKRLTLILPVMAAVFLILLSGCLPITCWLGGGLSYPSIFRFSVKNKTNSELTVKLEVGEIPSPGARYEDFTPFPEEIYKLANEAYSAEQGTRCVIKPGHNSYVRTDFPMHYLSYPEYEEGELIPKIVELKAKLLNKLVTFTLTISRGEEIIHRIAGWDVPDEDMENSHVDEKMYGYYDTGEDNWIDDDGEERMYPLFYTKIWNNGEPYWGSGATRFYIRVDSPDSVILTGYAVDFDFYDDDGYWVSH